MLESDTRFAVWTCWSVIPLCPKLLIIAPAGVRVLKDSWVSLISCRMPCRFFGEDLKWLVPGCCISLEVVCDLLSFQNTVWRFFVVWTGDVSTWTTWMGNMRTCNGTEMQENLLFLELNPLVHVNCWKEKERNYSRYRISRFLSKVDYIIQKYVLLKRITVQCSIF